MPRSNIHWISKLAHDLGLGARNIIFEIWGLT